MSQNFSLWCDFIERNFLEKEFEGLLNQGAFCGATSNPAIFASALKNPIYKEEIAKLKGLGAKEIYESLAIKDIKTAASKMLGLWKKDKDTGYISLEIDPFLEENIAESISEGKRLHTIIGMPNVMIKVPATEAGYEIMEALMRENIPVNATLIFTKEQTQNCLEAMRKGRGKGDVRGVISVFVSRWDRRVDEFLPKKWQRRLGILNAQECYTWACAQGSKETRVLFASTGVKGTGWAEDYYIKALLHPHSINTAPLQSIAAFLENGGSGSITGTHARVQNPLERLEKLQNHALKAQNEDLAPYIPDPDQIHESLSSIKTLLQEDFAILAQGLLEEGLLAFKEAFESMLREL
ncbi:transaldolase [Helicobacter mustelae]|uniref:Transaldolase n=1 Tax=Helicobacter mustelae (strain ATCC 43772 / CCUG 25715 / CIP 103759 / LMG 18044 / NCTC 12198 / R85-136P) TaxID=679897 RepID=D3UGR4_HELM1|nr:transaldolase [Helicobacter mustelae]CBG39685.1 transaldolase [Helicobacter mustelae 12198]SQH71191.1 transaldolase [Helicobacter mustelae]STP12318.1 transaldolase [Helicobacter mustelae]